MRNRLIALSTLAAVLAATPALAVTEVYNSGDTQVGVGGRLQVMGFGELLQNDPHRSAGRLYLFLKQSRLEFSARQGDYSLYSQLAFGGEDVYTNNTNLTLLDMHATGPLFGLATWRAGQFRVPYGRELMTNSGAMGFMDRSLVSPFFQVGRDVGATLQTEIGPVNVIGGLFTGGGRDVPQRYLPQILGIPLLAARVSVGDHDLDPYVLNQHDYLDTDRTRQTLAASALFTRDSRVGHSTVLNVKNKFDQSLLLSGGWNPYIAKKDPVTNEAAQGQLFQTGLDYAIKTPVAEDTTLSGEAELNYGNFNNTFGSLGVVGGRLQAGLYRNPYQAVVRYAILMPDAQFAATNTTAGSPSAGQTTKITPDGAPIQELTPGFTYFLNGDRLKLTLDFPILINAPIVTEKGTGNYNLVNQPDQTGLLTNPANSLGRQTVFQVRGGLQYWF